jgi:hypothetical protein
MLIYKMACAIINLYLTFTQIIRKFENHLLSYTRISVLPQVEEFLVVLDGFCCVAFPLDL